MRNLVAAAALIAACPVAAQDADGSLGPPAEPAAQSLPAPVDTPWPGGAIRLDIDATDVRRGIYRVTETIPLAPGTRRVTLLYPQWLPGNHGPRGPLAELVDLRFTAGGQTLRWARDPREVYAFHVDLPEGARELVATFLHTSPLQPSEGRVTMTQEMLNLQWEKMSLYPAGHYVRRIRVKPNVRFPAGWTAAVALDGAVRTGDTMRWAETDYETLVDSPIFAGAYFRKWDLGNAITLNVAADKPELLDAAPGNIAKLSALGREATAALGRAPYDRYEFLVALTDRLGDIGLEHLRSSENGLEPRGFIDWAGMDWDRNVLAHELVHAWNGKYRRPAKLWTPDYRTPMETELLWLYEGQTQFWGWVLSARSGVQTRETVLGMIANQAGTYDGMAGRAWRSVLDTTLDPVITARKPRPYATLSRSEDYYNEGALIWLEADQIIRAGTGGRKGLDDFARAFFAHPGDGSRVKTYELADIVGTLNRVYPHDWAAFLNQRIGQPNQPSPLAGIEKAGYRLVWRDRPNPFDKGRMDFANTLILLNSLGVTIDKEGTVLATRWGSPAFDAGIVNGAKIVAVNGVAYEADGIKRALTTARTDQKPVELLVKRGNRYLTASVPYYGGLRWPWLERIAGEKAVAPLDRLLAPRTR